MVVSLIQRSKFYVQDFPAQPPTSSFKEPCRATVEAMLLLAVGAQSYRESISYLFEVQH